MNDLLKLLQEFNIEKSEDYQVEGEVELYESRIPVTSKPFFLEFDDDLSESFINYHFPLEDQYAFIAPEQKLALLRILIDQVETPFWAYIPPKRIDEQSESKGFINVELNPAFPVKSLIHLLEEWDSLDKTIGFSVTKHDFKYIRLWFYCK